MDYDPKHSLAVVGFRPPDAEHETMRQAWLALVDAGLPVPTQLDEYFDYQHPEETGTEIDLEEWGEGECFTEIKAGFEIDVTKLPPGIKIIRVYDSGEA